MTETKTEPDGWCWNSPEGEWCGTEETIHVHRERPEGTSDKYYLLCPVCLVSPRLLDWVETVRTGFAEGWIRQSELGPNLLAELEEIRGDLK